MASTKTTTAQPTQTELLRSLYLKHCTPAAELICKLPKIPKSAKGKPKQDCRECGGYHEPGAFHLDYLGHADLTRILIEEDPLWTWRPVSFDESGSPLMDRDKDGNPIGMWMMLTVHGKCVYGYGSVEMGWSGPKEHGAAVKEIIGDGLRNSALRLGIALSLWSKADIVDPPVDETPTQKSAPKKSPPKKAAPKATAKDKKALALKKIADAMKAASVTKAQMLTFAGKEYGVNSANDLTAGQAAELLAAVRGGLIG